MTKMTAETIARRAAARKEEKHLNSLQSVAQQVKVGKDLLTLEFNGVFITGPLDQFNTVLEKLGLRPVRITSNMLNEAGGQFAIDINTPSYCDPGCESYHSM